MGSQQPFKRINKPLELLQAQLAKAAPALSRSELLDLADDIHDIVRARHSERFFDSPIEEDASFTGRDQFGLKG